MIKEIATPQAKGKSTAVIPIDIAVVIVSWNVRQYLAECLRSVFNDMAAAGLRGKIWVVDNASTDGSAEFVNDLFPNVELIENKVNLGFGAANNQGIQAAREYSPNYYFLLNPDTLVRSGAIGQIVGWMEQNPSAGMAGSRLVYGDGRLQHSAFAFPGLRQLLFEFWPIPARLYETRLNGRYPSRWYDRETAPFRVDHPLGAAMMVRKDVIESTHGFDEAFHMYCEEIDWAWRIQKAGWEIYTVPSAEIVHYGGESSKQAAAKSVVNLWQSRAQLYRKYYEPWKVTIASRIVRNGLERRAARATTPELQDAFRKASSYWS